MRRMGAVMVVLALATVACSDSNDDKADKGDGGNGAGAAETAAACDALVTAYRAVDIDEDLETGIAALEDFAAAAPEDEAALMRPAVSALREDPETAMEGEEVAAAENAADAYAVEQCGDTTVEVGTFDYAYTGVPAEIPAGRVVFNLTNHSESGEFHEFLVLRKPDGASEAAHEILAAALDGPLSIETAFAALETFGLDAVAFVEPDGGDTVDATVVDLEPGEYIAACLLPVGSPEHIEPYFGGEEVDADRHVDDGMYAEFTVS